MLPEFSRFYGWHPGISAPPGMSRRKALITGITGQDGSYLADLLLSKGYEVHGIIRPEPEPQAHVQHILGHIQLHVASLSSPENLRDVIRLVQPDECFHLAAQSFVSYKPDEEVATLASNVTGAIALLVALKEAAPKCRVVFAASSELFGLATECPQSETTPFHPRSVYGVSKLAGFELFRMYREVHGMFAASAILFNHESPRRGRDFVTRKITLAAAGILAGRATELRLGSLEVQRDWGHARDYVEAMWLIAQQQLPQDFVIATGQTQTVRGFVDVAFARGGLDSKEFVISDPSFYRPAESFILKGDITKARHQLGWSPRTSFEDLVHEMVEADCQAAGLQLKFPAARRVSTLES